MRTQAQGRSKEYLSSHPPKRTKYNWRLKMRKIIGYILMSILPILVITLDTIEHGFLFAIIKLVFFALIVGSFIVGLKLVSK